MEVASLLVWHCWWRATSTKHIQPFSLPKPSYTPVLGCNLSIMIQTAWTCHFCHGLLGVSNTSLSCTCIQMCGRNINMLGSLFLDSWVSVHPFSIIYICNTASKSSSFGGRILEPLIPVFGRIRNRSNRKEGRRGDFFLNTFQHFRSAVVQTFKRSPLCHPLFFYFCLRDTAFQVRDRQLIFAVEKLKFDTSDQPSFY